MTYPIPLAFVIDELATINLDDDTIDVGPTRRNSTLDTLALIVDRVQSEKVRAELPDNVKFITTIIGDNIETLGGKTNEGPTEGKTDVFICADVTEMEELAGNAPEITNALSWPTSWPTEMVITFENPPLLPASMSKTDPETKVHRRNVTVIELPAAPSAMSGRLTFTVELRNTTSTYTTAEQNEGKVSLIPSRSVLEVVQLRPSDSPAMPQMIIMTIRHVSCRPYILPIASEQTFVTYQQSGQSNRKLTDAIDVVLS